MKTIQKVKFTYSEIPEPKLWENAIYGEIKQENKVKISVVSKDKEKITVNIFRVLLVKQINLKKDTKFEYQGLIGSGKVSDLDYGYFIAEINYTKKTCKMKIYGGCYSLIDFEKNYHNTKSAESAL